MILYRNEFIEIIEDQCTLSDNVYWHINDRVLRLPTIEVITRIVDSFRVKKYLPEIADCDNRALLMASKFVKEGYCICMVDVKQLIYGENHPQFYHQLCMTVDSNKTVWMIEPEDSNIFKPSNLLPIHFIDART